MYIYIYIYIWYIMILIPQKLSNIQIVRTSMVNHWIGIWRLGPTHCDGWRPLRWSNSWPETANFLPKSKSHLYKNYDWWPLGIPKVLCKQFQTYPTSKFWKTFGQIFEFWRSVDSFSMQRWMIPCWSCYVWVYAQYFHSGKSLTQQADQAKHSFLQLNDSALLP